MGSPFMFTHVWSAKGHLAYIPLYTLSVAIWPSHRAGTQSARPRWVMVTKGWEMGRGGGCSNAPPALPCSWPGVDVLG